MMDMEHFRAIEAAAAYESASTRIQADLARAEALLEKAGIPFERTPDPTRPWMNRHKRDEAVAKAEAA